MTACAAPLPPGVELARLPDGRALAFRCTGQGSPTVLLEAGWAGDSRSWGRVAPLIARSTRVCAYDRAGLGLSDPGPAPRDATAIVRDLDDGLRAQQIAGPFVVVGHSAGGLYVRAFADRRPADVVGMVLADPSVEHQDARLAAVFGPGAGSTTTALRAKSEACRWAAAGHRLPSPDPRLAKCDAATPPSAYATQVAELDALWTATSDEVAAGRSSYGPLPLIVLTAGETNAGQPPAARTVSDRVWAGLHDEVAEHSTIGVRRTVASGHLMPKDRPDAIAAAVAEVIAAAKR